MKHWFNPTTKKFLHEVEQAPDFEDYQIKSEHMAGYHDKEPWCLDCVVERGRASIEKAKQALKEKQQ